MRTVIRKATREDVPRILAFIRALADYERAPEAAIATEADLERDGFGLRPFYECLIAEHDEHPAGFALYFSYGYRMSKLHRDDGRSSGGNSALAPESV